MLGLIEGRIRFLDELGNGVMLIRHQGRHPEAATCYVSPYDDLTK
jgi:hypothetical protein